MLFDHSEPLSLTGDILQKCMPCVSRNKIRMLAGLFTLFFLASIIGGGLVFFVLGGQEADIWVHHRNYATPVGIKIDNFCGSFQYHTGTNAFAGNIVPTVLAWVIILITIGCGFYHSENYLATVSLIVYTVLSCWCTIVKATTVANYKTTDSSCLDFWKAQDLQIYLDYFERESKLLIYCALASAPVIPLFIYGCCWLLINS
jgi:hypothetical protein